MAVTALSLISFTPAAALADTFNVTATTWGTGTTVGSLAWAIDQANQSAAASNTISIAPGLTINVDDATGAGSSYNLATILKSVTIQGNNATLVGNPVFVTTGGQAYTKNNPDPFTPTSGDLLVIPSFSFLKIGTYGGTNSGINVAVSNLNTDGINRNAAVYQGASLTWAGGDFEKSVNFTATPTSPVFEGFGATFTASGITVNKAAGFNTVFGGAFTGLFSFGDSTVNISNSIIRDSDNAGAIALAGGTANVVSSVLVGSGGIQVSGGDTMATGTLNFVNSVAYLTGGYETPSGDMTFASNRLSAISGGTINATASTIIGDLFLMTGSDAEADGVPLDANGGTINLYSSAVLVTTMADLPNQVGYRESNGGNLTADAYSWVLPTSAQNASALKALFDQPGLLTAAPGLPLQVLTADPLFTAAYPFPVGTYPVKNGALVDVVPDADTVNQLINPIDLSVITTDVYGDPRTAGGFRNAGAVQQVTDVPEIDPQSFGSAAAFILGALGMAERRRLQARSRRA